MIKLTFWVLVKDIWGALEDVLGTREIISLGCIHIFPKYYDMISFFV